jgi:segregation and condensation protein B
MPPLKQIIEAALFAASAPLTLEQLRALFAGEDRPERAQFIAALHELAADYQTHSIELVEVAGGFRMQVRASVAPWISRLWEERAPRYSRAMLETLALIAYRQPITRSEIEEIRGVAVSTTIIQTLTEREWVRVIGHRDTPGHPALYATTRAFLEYFGLRSLNDLPPLALIRDPNLSLFADALPLDAAASAPDSTDC